MPSLASRCLNKPLPPFGYVSVIKSWEVATLNGPKLCDKSLRVFFSTCRKINDRQGFWGGK